MADNRVSPIPLEMVQRSPSDLVGEQRPKVEPTVKRDTTQWILQDINAKAQKNMYHCGNNQEMNVCNVQKQENKSDMERTNYFGEIAFDNNHTAKYIRVHSNTIKPKTVLKLMKEQWKLEQPALLISVHGSMKSFKNSCLAKTCQTSLTKAVHSTGSWVITDGKQQNVDTDETADEQPIIIGISQWRAIHNKDQMNIQQGTRSAECSTENNSLNPHHSHFILIDDDGSGDTSSTTREFRKELEREIIKSTSDNGVPMVLLVFQGDDDSKRTVYDAPESKIPVVIVKESDKKANGNEARYEFPEDKITHICEWKVDSCESDLGLAIVKALSKAAKENSSDQMYNMTDHMYQLKLAVAWNMFGIAKNISMDTRKQEDILKSCMEAAILLDKVEYVKLILDNDFDLKTFLTAKILKKLYSAQFEGSLSQEVLLKMIKSTDMETNIHVTKLLHHVHQFTDDNSSMETDSAKKGCSCLPNLCCTSINIRLTDQQDPKEQSFVEHPWLDLFVWLVLNHRKDMAILFWRQGKPDYIKASTPEDTLTRGQPTNGAGSAADQAIDFMTDAMTAALFAHALLSAMSHEIDNKDLKEKCEKDSRDYTNLASEILNEGYTKGGVSLAKKLLIQKQKRWGNISCVLIAVNANNKQFISEHACQDVFNDIWMGDIDQETGILSNNLKLLLCIFCPFLILCLVQFKKTDPHSSQTHEQNKDTARCSSEPGEEPTNWNKIKYFYQAPVVKCFHNVISYMLFLGLYSYTMMTKFDRYLSWQEILLCVWVFTIFIEEVMQVLSTPSKGWKRKLSNYIRDGWNFLDIVNLFLFLCGMILRIFDNKQVAESAQVVHGVNLITFYLRLLQIFSVHRELGPKLVMIIRMVYNIAYFFMILVVFIVAYGIASHSILYPHTEPSFETFTEIFRRPYWNIYGELMLDKIEGSADCTNDPELSKTGTYSRCPTESGKYFVPLLLGVYMLMCNILLLNLLIAMFSFTFQKVQDNSYLYWSFQQYSLINEYANRPFLVPPVTIFAHLYQLIQWIRTCCKDKRCKRGANIINVFCSSNVVICDQSKKMIETFYKKGWGHNSTNVSEADSANLDKRMEQMEKKLNCLVHMQREILEKLGSSKV